MTGQAVEEGVRVRVPDGNVGTVLRVLEEERRRFGRRYRERIAVVELAGGRRQAWVLSRLKVVE